MYEKCSVFINNYLYVQYFFDCKHLSELQIYNWYDIMRLAAYKQYNGKIPSDAEIYSTCKLKRGYGNDFRFHVIIYM